MSLDNELKMWKGIFRVLIELPDNYRSRYHTDYLNEVVQRIYELNDLMKNV